ncbi:50S ribosomal protein L6 [Candidatus Pacearchaeota archaeon]|nr:50S ribosomal protein L6 [Candidatus Pacearchaeota archaeon]
MAEKNNQKDLREEIEVPEGMSARIEDNVLIIKKDSEELIRKINAKVATKVEGNKIILEAKQATKNKKKMFGTMKAHIKNMITGLSEKFKYKLEVANVHFPMNVSLDKEANILVVKNFLGERKDRRIKLVDGVEVKIDKNVIEIIGSDIEKAGQCAANIEKGTKVRNKDRRIFQDGIFIVDKPRRSFS